MSVLEHTCINCGHEKRQHEGYTIMTLQGPFPRTRCQAINPNFNKLCICGNFMPFIEELSKESK
jgi:hypothetical protein